MSKIKDARIKLGLTQHQFADLTGVPFRTIQNWENGVTKCPDYVERLLLEWLHSKTEKTICPICGFEFDK